MEPHDYTTADQELIRFFETHGRRLSYDRGELIVRAHDELQGVHYIVDGTVKAYSINETGEQYVHIVYKQGEIFPLIRLTDPAPANSFYSAFSDCTVLRTSQASVLEAIATDLHVARAFLEKAVFQFRIYATRVDNLQYKYARERLVYRLLFLASRFGVKQDDGSYTLPSAFTQQLIGDSINLSRESVSREFDRLRTKELIEYQGHSLIIKDWKTLSKEFHESVFEDWWRLD